MEPDQLFQEASARALRLEVTAPVQDGDLERVRLECAAFFDQIAEPPMYRRADDPARRHAEGLLPQGRELLARLIALERDPEAASRVRPLNEAMWWHLTSLCHVADGRLEAAEQAWLTAIEREGMASSTRRAWTRSDEQRRPVFDRATGVSRFDPSPEPMLSVKLVCPQCQSADRFALTPTYATHRFVCPTCRRPFLGYFGEARAVEITPLGGDAKRYVFRVQELNGGLAQLDMTDASGAEFVVARRDLLAFLYKPDRRLEAVLNLSSSRLLWVQRSGPCFVATAAFGEGAPELSAFRDFRDRALLRSAPGRWGVRLYYKAGPSLARWLLGHPKARERVRDILWRVHARLIRKGFS